MDRLIVDKNNLLFYSSLLVVFVMPFGAIRVISFSLILFGITWLLYENLGSRILSLKENRLFMLFSGLYLLLIIGLLYSQNLSNGIKQLEIMFSLLLIPLIFGSTPAFSKEQLKTILFSFVIGNLVVGSILLAYNINKLIVLGRPLNHLFHYDIYYSFTELFGTHNVYYSLYLTFCVALIIIYLFQGYKKNRFVINFLLTSITFFFLFLIFVMASRMQIAILFLILNMLIIWLSKNKIRAILTVFMLNVLLVSAIVNMRFTYYQYVKLIETELDPSYNSKGDKRMPRWIAALDIVKDNLIIGVGTGDTEEELVSVYTKHSLPHASEQRYNAHNQFLEIFITLGIVGLIYFVATLFIPFFLAVSHNHKIYVIFIIIISFSFLTESMLNRQQGVVFFAFFNSLLAFSSFGGKPSQTLLNQVS